MKTHWRAVDVFTDAANRTLEDCQSIAADHAAKGVLRSGATAKRAVAAFDVRSKEALGQILGEVANVVDHRGWRWRQEMAEVEKALEEHIQSAPEILGGTFRLAGLRDGGQVAVTKLIDQSAQGLRKDFKAFRDGWTSPRSKPWRERNATLYAILLALVGAVLGQIATAVADDVRKPAKSDVVAAEQEKSPSPSSAMPIPRH